MSYGYRSIVLTYNKVLTSSGLGDGTVNLEQVINLPRGGIKYLQLLQINMSKFIMNVTKFDQPFYWDNTRIRWTISGGDSWNTINLPQGSYTISTINDAITSAMGIYNKNPGDPAIFLAGTLVNNKAYVVINNAKAIEPYLIGIDFSVNASPDMANFLGFDPANSTFMGNGTYAAPNVAMLNLPGDSISVQLQGFGILSNKNGAASYEIANMPMIAYSSTANEFLHPLTPLLMPPIMLQQVPDTVTQYAVQFRGSRIYKGQAMPVVFVEGQCNVSFSLIFN